MNKILEIIMSISLLINRKENKLINMKNEEILFFLNTIYEQINKLFDDDCIFNKQCLASVACCSDDVKDIINLYQNDSNYNIVNDLKKIRNRLQGLMFGIL